MFVSSVREHSRLLACAYVYARVSSRLCAVGIGDEKCLSGRVLRSFCVAGAGNRAQQLLDFVAWPCARNGRVRARLRARRCGIVAGAGNPLSCGCKRGADVSLLVLRLVRLVTSCRIVSCRVII